MPRPRLNKKQRRWLNNFKVNYPWYKVREIHADLDGDRLIVLEGIERLPLPLIPEFANASAGYRFHTVKAKIRKYEDARYTSDHSCTTVYPHCDIGEKQRNTSPTGQLSLPIPAVVLEVPPAINPVIVMATPKQKLKPKQGVQLSLPVTGLEAKVFGLRQAKRPYLPPVSSQELLAEKVSTWSQRDQKEVELPQVMVDLLLAENADTEEWQSAIDLFGVIGLFGVMTYIQGIAYLRQCKGTPVSTAAASAAVVPAQIRAKTITNVSVKALS